MFSAIFIIFASSLKLSVGSSGGSWSYPSSQWSSLGTCSGSKQSPIDLQVETAKCAFALKTYELVDLKNAQFSLAVSSKVLSIKINPPLYFDGLGLPMSYSLGDVHFHWGEKDDLGSEHAINGRKFAMEQHMVLTNSTNLAVLAFLFEVDPTGSDNPSLQPLINLFGKFKVATEVPMDNFDGSLLIPSIAATSYFRYDGSLTVPDCTESVIWTVFSKTVKISKSQMEQFRMLNGDSSLKQTVQKNTFRELQNLNGREILCNFKKA